MVSETLQYENQIPMPAIVEKKPIRGVRHLILLLLIIKEPISVYRTELLSTGQNMQFVFAGE